jgi:UDP-glucuronate 4-epimerase
MTILVTGAAGFVGFHLTRALLARGEAVLGVDNLNAYYPPALKRARLTDLSAHPAFEFLELDIADPEALMTLVTTRRPRRIVHLAAQAGVRYSLTAPFTYAQSNLVGHLSVLEAARALGDDLDHLVYASSSSVYGDREGGPFRETDRVDTPESLYAATKRAAELMSETYGKLYGLPQSGLRFFTVYGTFGRPDMAYWSFTDKILRGEVIEVYNNGDQARDFTYIDDIVTGIIGVLDRPPARGVNRLLNIGGGRPERLMDMIDVLAKACGREPNLVMKPKQPGDVTVTCADTTALKALTGYAPVVPIAEGLPKFVDWYRAYTGI